MPELPEVETIRRDLELKVLNKKIKKVSIFLQKSVLNNKKFKSYLLDSKIISIQRRGKLLILELDNKKYLTIHLRMTGQLIYGKRIIPEKHTRVALEFNDNNILLFNDVRQFGYLKIINNQELLKILESYGIEPLTKNFKLLDFIKILKSSKRKLKQVLLDQHLIAGLGNIYVDEICFDANILPTRISNSLNREEIRKLFYSCNKIIKKAVLMRGTTFSDYKDIGGREGNYLKVLKVYGRNTKNCIKCNNKINKIKLFGRGTHFCYYCQK